MRKKVFLLCFLLILGLFLRFYRLSDWLYFNMDEERDAFIVKRILVNRHFTLIGGSVPGGIYVGPGLYYLSALPLLVARLNPVGLGVTASILGTLSILLIYKVASQFFNKRVGLISAALFASSFLMVIYNRHFWPLTPAPVIGLLVLFSLYQLVKKKNFNWAYLLSLALIVGLQSDPSNVIFLFLSLMALVVYKLPLKNKKIIYSFLLIIGSHLPLVFFDLRHDFLISRAFLKLFRFQGKTQFSFSNLSKVLNLFPFAFSRLIFTFGDRDISHQLTSCPFYQSLRQTSVPKTLFLISVLILAYWLIKGFKDKKNIGLRLISLQFIIAFLGIVLFTLIFPQYLREYFLAGLFPSFIILFSSTLEKFLFKKSFVLGSVFLTVLVGFNLWAVLTASHPLGFKNKMKGVKFVLDQVKDKPFFVESLSTCFKYNGIRYLFYLAGNEPSKSFMDSHYSWLYDHPSQEKDPEIGAVFVSHDKNETPEFWQEYDQYLAKTSSKKKFGGIEVLIINEKK